MGKGRRWPDNKGDGIAGCETRARQTKWERPFFPFPAPAPRALVMASSPPGTAVPSRNVLYPWLRYGSWRHGDVPFARNTNRKLPPFLAAPVGCIHFGTQRTARRICQDLFLGVCAPCPTTELRSSWGNVDVHYCVAQPSCWVALWPPASSLCQSDGMCSLPAMPATSSAGRSCQSHRS